MTDSELIGKLANNLRIVRSRIESACVRSGRPIDGVTLVAVTKYASSRIANMLLDAGAEDLGESRPQELWRKSAELPSYARWHLIGHLQRNKVDRTLPLVTMIHSVDSPRLIEAMGSAAANLSRPVDVLLEVNLSGEAAKTGMRPEMLDEMKKL
ncbi:MAG: alanine racemase, partial [Gemmataceae bacterium]|nr:alanine racemase [Gemmataceae bacterium]